MSKLKQHVDPGSLGGLTVQAVGETGANGAQHAFEIGGFNALGNPSNHDADGNPILTDTFHIRFQEGPIGSEGPNGVPLGSVLLAIKRRLEGLQRSVAFCPRRARAIEHVKQAMTCLDEKIVPALALVA